MKLLTTATLISVLSVCTLATPTPLTVDVSTKQQPETCPIGMAAVYDKINPDVFLGCMRTCTKTSAFECEQICHSSCANQGVLTGNVCHCPALPHSDGKEGVWSVTNIIGDICHLRKEQNNLGPCREDVP